jgi:hypothetical protein
MAVLTLFTVLVQHRKATKVALEKLAVAAVTLRAVEVVAQGQQATVMLVDTPTEAWVLRLQSVEP